VFTDRHPTKFSNFRLSSLINCLLKIELKIYYRSFKILNFFISKCFGNCPYSVDNVTTSLHTLRITSWVYMWCKQENVYMLCDIINWRRPMTETFWNKRFKIDLLLYSLSLHWYKKVKDTIVCSFCIVTHTSNIYPPPHRRVDIGMVFVRLSVRPSVRLSERTDRHLLGTKIPNKCIINTHSHSFRCVLLGTFFACWVVLNKRNTRQICENVRQSVRLSVRPSVLPWVHISCPVHNFLTPKRNFMSQMFSSSRRQAEPMFQHGRLKVKVNSGVWRFEICISCPVLIISSEPLEGISWNFSQMLSPWRRCAEPMFQPVRLKVKVTSNVWRFEPCILCPVHIFWTPRMNIMKLWPNVHSINMMCRTHVSTWPAQGQVHYCGIIIFRVGLIFAYFALSDVREIKP
jgi:hypothetical protein